MKRLAKLTKRIVEKYRPDCVVLLETADEEKAQSAHLDLIILKETQDPPPQRRTEVENSIADSDIAIDVAVYTPDELKYLYSTGSPFVHRVMREGRLLYVKRATMLWVSDAREELESAKVLNDHEIYRAACYHGRRAIEKGLHAMIMSKSKRPEATDDLMELYNGAKALGFKTGLSEEDIVYVNNFSKHKYPVEQALLPHFKPSSEDAERAIDSARRLVEKLAALKVK